MKQQEYKMGDNVTWVNCGGDFKTIDEMSFKQRLGYKFRCAKQDINYAWRRYLAGNRDNNALAGSFMTGSGFLAVMSGAENGNIGAILFGFVVTSYGIALLKARRKGGTFDKIFDALNEDEKIR